MMNMFHSSTRRAQASAPLLLVSLLAQPRPAGANVTLPIVFGDNAVLQRGTPLPVWGTADAGEEVTVTVRGVARKAVAGPDGKWQVTLAPLEVGEPFELTVAGKNTIVRKNLLAGEVWVCAGQSNMYFPLQKVLNGEKEVADANYPQMRVFNQQWQTVTSTPLHTGYVPAANISAVAYFFGCELHRTLGVPIGLITKSVGGTPAEAWTPRSALEARPELQPMVKEWDRFVTDYPAAQDAFEKKYQQDVEAAKAAGKPEPRRPHVSPPGGPNDTNRPSILFDRMIAPVIPFAIRGVAWYQGESNAERAAEYRVLFPTLIQSWRKAWGQGDFPFVWVQLANYKDLQTDPNEGGWAELREAQLRTLALPKTGMAVTIDVGEARDIHPRNKQEVGRRLALWALASVYGKDIPFSGPLYQSMKVEDGKVRLTFDHAEGGLKAAEGALKGFALAGADGKFVWGDAVIEGSVVIVSSPQIKAPNAVRYSWASNPIGNLVNGAGLPASPFRTDGPLTAPLR